MKPVPLTQIRRAAKKALLQALEDAQTAVDGLPEGQDNGQKGKYIDNNSDKWSAIKEELWKLGNMKCWYSEAELECNLAEVEHFRPKKRVTGEHHCGYWWCAFKWQNFRISHPLVNKRLTDYQTGKVVGKGCYFPLRDGSPRAQNAAEQNAEEHVLLDPAVPSDCQLIVFDSSNGTPVPRYQEDADGWLNYRAKESIDFYHLDEGTWNASREDIMKAVGFLCDQLITMKESAPYDQNEYDQVIQQLYEYLNPYAEFLSAAEQVTREKGIDIRF